MTCLFFTYLDFMKSELEEQDFDQKQSLWELISQSLRLFCSTILTIIESSTKITLLSNLISYMFCFEMI
jgi:hypothetical protein